MLGGGAGASRRYEAVDGLIGTQVQGMNLGMSGSVVRTEGVLRVELGSGGWLEWGSVRSADGWQVVWMYKCLVRVVN